MRTCCEGCKSSDLINANGGIVSKGPYSATTSQADPLIQPNAIHWVLSKECYASKFNRRPNIEGWARIINEEDYIIYANSKEFAICAFRGTSTIQDFKSNAQLSVPGSSCSFEKVGPAIKFLRQFLESTNYRIQLTGHSLGGALARCVGAALNLGVVTFNPAAPPINPVSISSGSNQVHYHIVFDVISAWIPSIRIDKQYRPHKSGISKYLVFIPAVQIHLFSRTIQPFLDAHAIDNFSNEKSGLVVSSEFENNLWQEWFKNLPFVFKKTFLYFINAKSLPSVAVRTDSNGASLDDWS